MSQEANNYFAMLCGYCTKTVIGQATILCVFISDDASVEPKDSSSVTLLRKSQFKACLNKLYHAFFK